MLVYPQLSTGALSQFPIQKRRKMRTITNQLGDGSTIKMADATAETIEWHLSYVGLSDSEALALEEFFQAAEGSLNVFTFVDPAANLLAWSERLDKPVWNPDPLLGIAGGFTDTFGGNSAWHISNPGMAPQKVLQTLAAPGGYVYCVSMYARSSQPTEITLLCADVRADRAVSTGWSRLSASGSGSAAGESVSFGIQLAPGVAVDICGLQVEPQAAASAYKASVSGGVYPNAYFAADDFAFTTTAPNRHSVMVHLLHAHRL